MTQTLNLYTMQTLFEQPVEPVDFIVEGLLAPGLYILGGSPKVGKAGWHCSFVWRCATGRPSSDVLPIEAKCSILHWKTARSDCTPVRCISPKPRLPGFTFAGRRYLSDKDWSSNWNIRWTSIRISVSLFWTPCKRCAVCPAAGCPTVQITRMRRRSRASPTVTTFVCWQSIICASCQMRTRLTGCPVQMA